MTQYVKAVRTPVAWHEAHARTDRFLVEEVTRHGRERMSKGEDVLYGEDVDGLIHLKPEPNGNGISRVLRKNSIVRNATTAIYVCDFDKPTWGVRQAYYYVEFISPQEYVRHLLNS